MFTWSIERAILNTLADAKAVAKYLAALALGPVIDAVYPVCKDAESRPCDTGDCWYDAHGHNCPNRCFDGAEELAEREAEQDVWEPSEPQCRVHHPLHPDWLCTKPYAHDGEHGYAGCFWSEGPLTDDELIAVRGLIQERYHPTNSSPVHGVPGDGPAADSDIPPSPAAGNSGEAVSATPPAPASPRPPWSDLADAMVEHRHPSTPAAGAETLAAGSRDLSAYNATHCCKFCGCAGVVAHFDHCTRPHK